MMSSVPAMPPRGGGHDRRLEQRRVDRLQHRRERPGEHLDRPDLGQRVTAGAEERGRARDDANEPGTPRRSPLVMHHVRPWGDIPPQGLY